MQRVKRATAVAVLPNPPGGGTPGYFAQPNPGSVPATVPGYEWYNNVQEEMLAVIEGQGLVASDTDRTQLRQAISKMIQAGQRGVILNNCTFAGAVTGAGKVVYWDSGNSRFDLALADGSAKQSAVGFADVPNGNVYCFGDAVLFAGLTPGARYYLDPATAGAITTAMPTSNAVFIGIAKNATEVFVDIDAQPSTVVKQLQSVSATVAANALTLGLNPTSLDFRSSVLTNGVPNNRTVGGALSLVVPSGATLGTVSGQSARLALLAIDNAGTVELAVVNVGGGVNLDETTLINTTAISAASNSASTIYSANARAGVPFRLVEFVDITEAAAGTWSSAPTLVQPAGGQALAALGSFGYGQSWQNMTGSRVSGSTYYNTTGRPISVSAWGTLAYNSTLTGVVNGVTVALETVNIGPVSSSASEQAGVSFIVPPGAPYSITVSGSASTFAQWSELR